MLYQLGTNYLYSVLTTLYGKLRHWRRKLFLHRSETIFIVHICISMNLGENTI